MKKLFELDPLGHDKAIFIKGPVDIEVDYDDVNHYFVDRFVPYLIDHLNKMNPEDIKMLEIEAEEDYKSSEDYYGEYL